MQVVKPKEKYNSERPEKPPEGGRGPHKIVAADFMDRVVNSTHDVLLFQYFDRYRFYFLPLEVSAIFASQLSPCVIVALP